MPEKESKKPSKVGIGFEKTKRRWYNRKGSLGTDGKYQKKTRSGSDFRMRNGMRFVSIASGSSGNCIYLGTDHTHILIDAGISCKRINNGLEDLGIKSSELDGIFITHEHSDHIQGLRVFSKKFGVPIYGTKETLEEIAKADKKGEIDPGLYHPVALDVPVPVKEMQVLPFSSSHDAANPVVYRVDGGGKSAAVVTDLGCYSDYTLQHLQNLDGVLLESNHDVRMLEIGPYPYYLKRRILGERGHLSNDTCGELLNNILHDGIKHIFLGHLSKENNYEALAYETVRTSVTMAPSPYKGDDFSISVAGRDHPSEIVYL